jgi:hypothetical protein
VRDVHHSVDLDLRYALAWPDGQAGASSELVLVFEDGIQYTWREALTVSHVGGSREDLRLLHRIKTLFDGQILPDETVKDDGPPRKGSPGTAGMSAHLAPLPPWPASVRQDQKSAGARAADKTEQLNLLSELNP